jgi:hypothetical protein
VSRGLHGFTSWMIEQQATLKVEKWATTHLFSRSAPNLRDSRRLISSGSLSLFLSACDVYWSVISRDLYALALSNCCSPAAGALYYDDVSAAAAASQEKKEAHHALLLCRQLFMSFISLCTCCLWWCCYWPRSMRQQNKLRAAFVFAVFSVETPRFAVCTPFYHAILEEKLKINCVSFNL